MDAAATTSSSSSCPNCGTPLLGEHCHTCGQPVKGIVRHFSSFIGDFFDSVFNLDARIPRTLGPLFVRPGHLSNEYFDGRWVRYVSPVRLFGFLCVVSFFVLQLTVETRQIDRDGGLGAASTADEVERARAEALNALEARRGTLTALGVRESLDRQIAGIEQDAADRLAWIAERDAASLAGRPAPPVLAGLDPPSLRFNGEAWHPQHNPLRFDALPPVFNHWLNGQVGRAQRNLKRVRSEPRLLVDTVLQTLPQTFFILLPLFALLLKLVLLFQRRLYMEHLIVALHGHAFLCLALLLVVCSTELGELFDPGGLPARALEWLEIAILAWMPLYLLLMQKRVYRQGWLATCFKFVVIGTIYSNLLAIGVVANVMLNLVTL